MNEVVERLEELLKALGEGHPLNNTVFVAKRYSKKDLCDSLREIMETLKVKGGSLEQT